MALPAFQRDGCLPPGIHAATLAEVLDRFGTGSPARQEQGQLLAFVVQAAVKYETIKRVLVWGSFVTTKAEPGDLDYSLVTSGSHTLRALAETDRRFLDPAAARAYYGVDRGYLLVADYPIETYIERLDFVITSRLRLRYGIVEISLRGEMSGDADED